jgi:D-alanyl-D-alanine carboxypeptidase
MVLSFFFLFYPGDEFYIKIFSFNRPLFAQENKFIKYQSYLFPYVINKYFVPEISAEGAYVINLNSFTPVFEKNIQKQFLPASTTKILTALVACDIYKMDDVLTVKRAIQEGQIMELSQNERITAENLLYGLLVHSANDAAYVLADNYQGGFNQFVEMMNKKARDLGMKSSLFKNPAGFDDFSQYTTPYDLALACRELLINKQLAKIVSTKSITISDIDFKHFHQLINVNKLLGEIPGIGGLKTGYTLDAGENLVSFYKKNGYQSLIIILKSEDRFLDTKKTVEWLDKNIGYIDSL